MNAARLCIKNNRSAWLILSFIVLSGLWTYVHMPRLEDPEFTVRSAVVITTFPGAPPKRVEKLVTDKLEDKIREIAEVETITSQSKAGISIIQVQVADEYKDLQPIWQRLRNKVNDSKSELPAAAGEPEVNDEFGDVYGILLALSGKDFSHRELENAAQELKDQFLQINHVDKVQLHGVQPKRIFVEFSNSRLAELEFTPQQLIHALHSQNTIQPSGSLRLGPERILLETSGEFKSKQDIAQARFLLPGSTKSIALQDIADIRFGYRDPPRHLSRFNQKPCLVLALSMDNRANSVQLGKKVQRRLEQLQKELPLGLTLEKIVFQPRVVQESIFDFTLNLLEAFAFVIIVMFAFVGLRTGIAAALLIPMAMLAAIMLMPLFGVKLQIVSIGALIVSLGILVDNGVVVSENILVQINEGRQKLQAVADVVKRLWLPLLVASLTTIFAFLPIPLAQSKTGEYTASLFIVVSLTLLMSWILSMTFVPLFAYYFFRTAKKGKKTYQNFFYRAYAQSLLWTLQHRKIVLFVASSAALIAIIGFTHVPRIFFPPNERNILYIDLWLPYGTDIRSTEKRAVALENFLQNQTAVKDTLFFVGYGGPRWYLAMDPQQTTPNYAFALVKTNSEHGLLPLKKSIAKEIANNFPDCRTSIRQLKRGPPVGAPIQIRLSGEEIQEIYTLRDLIWPKIAKISAVTEVWDDWGEWSKRIMVQVRQEQAKRIGLSSEDIAVSLRSQYSGIEISQYRQGDDLIPIVARSQKDYREFIWKLPGINIYSSARKQNVPLMQVADIKIKWAPSNIRRRNNIRTMTIKADVRPGAYPSEILQQRIKPEIERLQDSQGWLSGYSIEYGGEFEKSMQANASIIRNVPLALGLILLVLVLQFNSIRRVLIIALTIPPMFIGVTAGMFITASPFGFMALLGIISLVGIIVNNAIMMIDQIETERQDLHIHKAIIVAAKRRLRPILMTATTTILGLIPLALQGGRLWEPMANTLIFGLAFSTLLTLFLCPLLYSLFFRINYRNLDIAMQSDNK